MERFPRDSAVLPRTSVFSGRAPMCRGSRSAHGRISTALSAGVFPHDSADLPRAGPGRMCSTAPASPRTAQWVRRRRPDTPDPATRATAPRGSPEKPRPGPGPARTRGSPPPPRRSDLRAAILGEKGPAHVMRDQRNRIHLSSRDASPARHNPPALALREPASHNARPGDMTNSTPPGGAPARSIAARGGARTGPGAVVPAQGLRAPARRTCPMLAK